VTTVHRLTPPPRGRAPSRPGAETAQVQSLMRGLSILECLARSEGGLTLTDIAHRVALPASTTHRLLGTLEKTGFVYPGSYTQLLAHETKANRLWRLVVEL
jgi:hypothetical protein